MARAGFYEVRPAKLRFGRDGRWYADDEPITNERIARFFSQHLVRGPDGRYLLRVGREEAPVEVEDTPFVVVGVALDPPRGDVRVELNDGTVERLDPATLRVGAGEVLYCRVKGGRERARFLRSAYYQLAPHIEEVEPDRFALMVGGRAYPIRREG